MRPLPRSIEVIDDQTAEVYRRMSVAQKIAVAHGMWRYARERLTAAVRWLHPDWDERAVRREVARRLLNGSDGPPEPPARRA
jgi:hypothetical protein